MSYQPANKRLQRTVMHKVPRHMRHHAAAEPRRCADIKALLGIFALALCAPQRPVAAETLEPCDATPNEYYLALDSQIDAGTVGRIVASVTAIPFQAPEWGVRVRHREGAYVVRVSVFAGSLFYSHYFDRVSVPVRAAEFSLEPGLGQRIVAAVGREMAKAHSSDYMPVPDNPIFRFSTDGTTCGSVTWQSTESVAYKLTQVFSELKCVPDLPPRKHRAVYKKIEGILNEIEAVDVYAVPAAQQPVAADGDG